MVLARRHDTRRRHRKSGLDRFGFQAFERDMKAVLLAVLLAACQQAVPIDTTQPPTPTVVAPAPKAVPTVLSVSRGGERLGTITIMPGELGTLEITGAIAAKWLIDAWAEVKQRGEVRVHMHLPTED